MLFHPAWSSSPRTMFFYELARDAKFTDDGRSSRAAGAGGVPPLLHRKCDVNQCRRSGREGPAGPCHRTRINEIINTVSVDLPAKKKRGVRTTFPRSSRTVNNLANFRLGLKFRDGLQDLSRVCLNWNSCLIFLISFSINYTRFSFFGNETQPYRYCLEIITKI